MRVNDIFEISATYVMLYCDKVTGSCRLLPLFIMEGNGDFCLDVSEKKDSTVPIQVHRPAEVCGYQFKKFKGKDKFSFRPTEFTMPLGHLIGNT